MWNFLWGKKQRKQHEREFRWTVIAPETRGQEETTVLRENTDDLGATVALRRVIEASRPRNGRVLSSHTTQSLSVNTNVSNVSADSEEYIRDPYSDDGRRQARKAGGSASSPLAVVPPTRAADLADDHVKGDKSRGKEVEKPLSIREELFMDCVGSVMRLTTAATLAAGPPGRQYITSGAPPPDQRGRAQIDRQAQPLSTPRPLQRTLTKRHRTVSSPAVVREKHGASPPRRSASSF